LAEIQRVNPSQLDAASPISALGSGPPCGAPRASISFGGGFGWFVCEVGEGGRVNIHTGKAVSIGLEAGVLTSPSSVQPEVSDARYGVDSLWIVNRATNEVVELDPLTNQKQQEITVGEKPEAIAVDTSTRTLWVANFGDDTVERISIPGAGETPSHSEV